MEIRNMQLDDYNRVYALWLSCPGMGLNNLDDSQEGIKKYLARNPDTCFVAVEQGCIIGAILAGHDGRRGYISHTAVSPTHQRQGVGKQLVEAALNALMKRGFLHDSFQKLAFMIHFHYHLLPSSLVSLPISHWIN